MSGTKEKIGILGGTFDPIHMGHLIIAEQARDQYSLDRVLLIPSGHSYFKDNREQKVLSGQMRLEMTRIAAEGYAPFRVSDIEVNRPGNTYSFETLEEIAQDNPGAELYFIVGADTVCSMRTWKGCVAKKSASLTLFWLLEDLDMLRINSVALSASLSTSVSFI